MLKKITLHNFMSHADTTIELTEGMNLFVGSSFSGKSAIMDGIYWVISNRPLGDSFVSYWAKDQTGKQVEETFVTLEFEDLSITRLKSRTENKYIINGNPLEAVGTDLPVLVSQAINFSEVNFQHQMDPLFLVSATGGEVAKLLNKAVKFDLIDTFLSGIDGRKRAAKREIDAVVKNIAEADKELSQFPPLETIEEALTQVEEKEKELITLESAVLYLENTTKVFHEKQDENTQTRGVLDKSSGLIGRIEQAKEKHNTISLYLDSALSTIARYSALLSLLDKGPAIEKSERLFTKVARYADMVALLQKDISFLDAGRQTFLRLKEEMKKTKEEYIALEASLPNVCPTCGKAL